MWHRITIRNYPRVQELLKIENPVDRVIKIFSLLYNKPESYYENLPLGVIRKLKLDFTPPSSKLPKLFWFKGRLYKISYKVDEFKAGKYSELMTWHAEHDRHKFMASLCTPVWGKQSHKERAELFLDLPMSLVYPISLFFSTLWTASINGIQDYLTQEIQTMKMMVSTPSLSTGDGSSTLMPSQETEPNGSMSKT